MTFHAFRSRIEELSDFLFKSYLLAVGYCGEDENLLKADEINAGRDDDFPKEGTPFLSQAGNDSNPNVRWIRAAIIGRDKNVAGLHVKGLGDVLEGQMLSVPRENTVHAASLNLGARAKFCVEKNIGDRVVVAGSNDHTDKTRFAENWH